MESPHNTDRPRLVSRSVPLADPVGSFRTLVDAMEPPRTVWNAADEARVVAGGAAATLTADGENRFEGIRTAAERLFETGDVHAGTEAACPRLFGGFAFHGDGAADNDTADNESRPSPWAAFPNARFVFPRVQVTQTDSGPWLTVNAVGPAATPAAVEAKLDDERERLARSLTIEVADTAIDDAFTEFLATALGAAPGACPVRLLYCAGEVRAPVQLGDGWQVKPTEELLQTLRERIGGANVRVAYAGDH